MKLQSVMLARVLAHVVIARFDILWIGLVVQQGDFPRSIVLAVLYLLKYSSQVGPKQETIDDSDPW